MKESIERMGQSLPAFADRNGEYLTFFLANEEYGINIMKIKEIIGVIPITPLPQAPDSVKGVINLRGKLVPVVDLRLRFGMGSISYTQRTCIIIVEIGETIDIIEVGIVVDSVSEVLNIKGEDIDDNPVAGSKLNTGYILGMAKTDGGVKILLDTDRILNADTVIALEKAA